MESDDSKYYNIDDVNLDALLGTTEAGYKVEANLPFLDFG